MNWHQITQSLGREPRVGDWWSQCCELDLYQIESEDDLQSIKDMVNDGDEIGLEGIWSTREEGLKHFEGDEPWL